MNKRRWIHKCCSLSLILVLFLTSLHVTTAVAAQTSGAIYYVDATGGDDGNNGTSPSSAWQTIFRVNNSEFNPGDSILFKRGEVWRERLVVSSSGDSGNYITFGAYGTGNKPLILGSVERNETSDWYEEEANIWSTVDSKDDNEMLDNPSFTENLDGWIFYTGDGATASLSRDTEIYDSSLAGARIDCVSNNQGHGSIFFYAGDYNITGNEWYILSFRVKGSSTFSLCPPNLVKTGVGSEYYSLRSRLYDIPIGTEWMTCNLYYLVNTTANDGQVFLGFGSIPDGESLYIDTLSFQRCDKAPVAADVGCLIFNGGESVGVKVDNKSDLDTRGEFWYDTLTGQLKMYSTRNPASHYSDIECALGVFATTSAAYAGPIVCIYSDYITVENLDLRYGGADGIWVEDVEGVVIKDCDISYCGGTRQNIGDSVRMGNGINLWENAHDCTVEGCRVWEIYDAAISNQGEATNNQYNLYYRNNLIWNSEYSFEIWDKPESANMNNIYVEGNVCIGAGFGWSHKQRPDPHGWHLALWGNESTTDDIYIRNNVFYEAAFSALYYDTSIKEYHGLVLDNNYYYQKSGEMLAFKYDTKYTMGQFSKYQSEKGYDLNSVTGDKEVVQEAAMIMSREEDMTLLNDLFSTTDELEATKNEGVTLDGAEFVSQSDVLFIIIGIVIGIGVVVAGVIMYRRRRSVA